MKKPKVRTISKAKKECWHTFSIYIRTRDCLLTTRTLERGKCITCGKEYGFKELQAGHFVGGRHNGNLFSETGVHAQCYGCNVGKKGHQLEYRRQMIKLYGVGADLAGEKEARQKIQYKVYQLDEMKEFFKNKTKALVEEYEKKDKIHERGLGGKQ